MWVIVDQEVGKAQDLRARSCNRLIFLFKLRLRNVNIRKHQHAEITYGSNFLTYLFTILAVPNTVKYSLGINKKNQKLQVISSHQKLQVISSPNHISKHSTALCCHKFIRLFCTLFISFLFNGLLQSISFWLLCIFSYVSFF